MSFSNFLYKPDDLFKINYVIVGEFAGFDENEPTSRDGGKGEVIKILKEKHGYSNVVLIGDGATDLEACPPADAFIGKYCIMFSNLFVMLFFLLQDVKSFL